MLSLSPRYDLFRFQFPRDFLPTEISEKYTKILNREPGVLVTAIDYLNESIKGTNLPGISDINVAQQQHSTNAVEKTKLRLNVEPKTDIIHTTTSNPLDKINKEFKVTFRMNQGLYNYFMMYETIFHYICKPMLRESEPVLYIELLDEDGVVRSRIKYMDCHIDGIDGLDFTFNKTERDSGEFEVTFKFNNIDFEML